MASIAASLPRARSSARGVRPWAVALLLCGVAAGLYGWMRVPVGQAQAASFQQICANIGMEPGDWPCRMTETRAVASQVGSALLTWLAVAVPVAILAASGRRFSWAWPMGLAAAATAIATAGTSGSSNLGERLFGVSTLAIGSGNPSGFWFAHPVVSVVVDLALASVPAAAIAFVVRPPRRPSEPIVKRHASWVATFGVVGTIVVLSMLWPHLPIAVFFQTSASKGAIAMGFVALFAAMLGTDRRWWPWALAPVAILVSLGPTMAVGGIPARFVALSWFAGVAPLGLAAFVGSLWRPIASRLGGESRIPAGSVAVVTPAREGSRTPHVSSSASPRTPAVRPVVVLNAVAVAMLAVSLIAVRADPLPVQISTALPTYLGARDAAFDVRAKMNLLEAVRALEAARSSTGSFVTVDADAAERHSPELRWTDRRAETPLVVSIEETTRGSATILVRSASGVLFCARTDGVEATYGSASVDGGGYRDPTLVARALADCGSRTLGPDAVRMFDVAAMCALADDQAIMLCRSVQRRIIEPALASPTVR